VTCYEQRRIVVSVGETFEPCGRIAISVFHEADEGASLAFNFGQGLTTRLSVVMQNRI
jgi:hypothetical protein